MLIEWLLNLYLNQETLILLVNSCDDFVLFVCFFLFYHNEYIISILLIIAGVNSNLMITKEKVNQFLDCFNIDKYLLKDLDEYLEIYKITLPEYIHL